MHIPVLLEEVLKYLNPRPGGKFIDATIGGGGHGLAILGKIQPGGKLLGIEWDSELLKQLERKAQSEKGKAGLILINGSYVNLQKIAGENGFSEADGALFDLGMSSWHIEESGRGFSFQRDEPLDMRFANATTNCQPPTTNHQLATAKTRLTAEEMVNRYSYAELVKILKEYGEERFARPIAGAIVKARKEKPIVSAFQLVEVLKEAVPFWYRRGRRIHFATKTFQALRIAVNHELENIEAGLKQAVQVLRGGGRLAVISFHSLEDRIVKNFLRDRDRRGVLRILTKKPIRAVLAETSQNPRARSAKLRAAEKR